MNKGEMAEKRNKEGVKERIPYAEDRYD